MEAEVDGWGTDVMDRKEWVEGSRDGWGEKWNQREQEVEQDEQKPDEWSDDAVIFLA